MKVTFTPRLQEHTVKIASEKKIYLLLENVVLSDCFIYRHYTFKIRRVGTNIFSLVRKMEYFLE